MEIYVTKKVENADDFAFDIPQTIPYMHVVTPEVIIKCDHNDNFYIAECPGDPNYLANLIKIKKVICKSILKHKDVDLRDKYRLQDDVIWIKQSPIMMYKNNKNTYGTVKILLNHPVSLELSFKNENFYGFAKPYNLYNMHFTINYIHVPDDFNWAMLQ